MLLPGGGLYIGSDFNASEYSHISLTAEGQM